MQCIQNCLNAVTDWVGVKAIPSLVDLKPRRGDVLLEVPCYSQTDDYSCGAIAGWSMVETFHPQANFERFYQRVAPTPEEGVGPQRLVAALRQFKVGTRNRARVKWEDIKQSIDEGFPMLVGTGKEDPALKGDHWSTLIGYSTHYRGVYLGNQPGVMRNQVLVDWGDFIQDWWNPKGRVIQCWGV